MASTTFSKRLQFCALLLSFSITLVKSSCTQGQPLTCSYAHGNSASFSSTNKINPCIDYVQLIGLATGYETLVSSKLLHQLSEPSPSTFCFGYACGNAGVGGGLSTQNFNGTCAEGYYGFISATCQFKAQCWHAGNLNYMRGLLMYNIGANQTSGSLATNLALPGQCTSSTTTIYPSDYSYIGFDKSSATSVDPIFAYTTSCNACLIGYSCPAGTRLLSDATPCPPGYFCPGGTKQACNAGTFVSSFSATRTTSAECFPCSPGFYSNAGSGSCLPCPSGTYGPNSGMETCLPCPSGTYSTATGQISASTCTACSTNQYSFSGASSCADCPSGSPFVSSSLGCAFQPLTLSRLAPVQAGYISANQGEDKKTHSVSYWCFFSLVTSSGRLLFWNRCTGASFFLSPPVLPGSALRFISVYVTYNQVVAELDNGGVVFILYDRFIWNDNFVIRDSSTAWGYLPGPFLQVVTFGIPPNGAPPTQCALRADGEIQCWSWSWNVFAAPFILGSGRYRDISSMTTRTSLCGASCSTFSGPYRSLVAFNRGFTSTVMTLCAIRVHDNRPFCTSTSGSWITSSVAFLLPDVMPLRKYFPAPYNESLPVKKLRISDSGQVLSVPYNDSTRTSFFLNPSSLPIETNWKDLINGQRGNYPSQYDFNFAITNEGISGWTGQYGYGFTFSLSSIRGISCAPIFEDTYFKPPFCLQTETSSLECYQLKNNIVNTQFRDDTPLAPPNPIQPIAFVGLRQRDTVCMLLPIVFDWITWTMASLRTHYRCFGDSTLEVQFPTSAQMEQISLPNLASTTLSVGENSICAILPKGNVSQPSCWGGCVDVSKFGTMCSSPSTVNSTAIYVGSYHTCVINGDSNQFSCFGQLPGGVPPPQLSFLSGAASSNMTCAILALNQSLYCFGAASSIIPSVATVSFRASLGVNAAAISATDGSTFFISTGPFKVVVSGGDFVCALPTTTSLPVCVGSNSSGQLAAPSVALTSIACGAAHCCGIVFSTASVACWGSDSAGQVSGALSLISSGESFSRITATLSGSCGITLSGYIRCWGSLAKYVDSVAFPFINVIVGVNATIYVGLPGGNDNSCKRIGGGGSCATLAGAVNALTSSVSVIAVYACGPSAAFEIPSTRLPGLVITGISASGTTLPTISFTSSLLNGNIITLANSAVVISNLILDGSSVMNCSDAIYMSGLYDYLQNVTLRSFNCNNAIINANSSTAALVNVFSYGATDTLLIQNVAFESVSSPIFIRTGGQSAVKIENVIARSPSSPSVFLVVSEAQRVNISGVILSGFIAPSPGDISSIGLVPSTTCGVGVTAMNTQTVEISNSSFTDMIGNSLSSVICVNGSLVLAVQVLISSCRFTNITAAGPGAAVHVTAAPNATIFILKSTFLKTRSMLSGGSIFLFNSGVFSLLNVTFDTSTSSTDGGAIAVISPRMFSASGVKISSTQSYKGFGGALYISDFEVASINALTVEDASANLESGGGLALVCSLRNQCLCNLMKSSFNNCSAPLGFGGGISAMSTSLSSAISFSVDDCSLSECQAGFGGGGISFNGGISLDDQPFTIGNTFFSSNEVLRGPGGAIHIDINVPAFISTYVFSSTFINNRAYKDGGAIFSILSTVKIAKSQFLGNVAPSGGAISTRNSILYLDSCSFDSNRALISGGAIAVFSCVLGGLETTWIPLNPPLVTPAVAWNPSLVSSQDASGTVFINNTAGSVGGAIYTSGCSMSLSFITLLLNKATSGGGIFVDSPAASNTIAIGPIASYGNVANGGGGGAITVSLSATQATKLCPRTFGINSFAFAGWNLKSWNLSVTISQERLKSSSSFSSSFFSSPSWRNVGKILDMMLASTVPSFFPPQNVTISTNVTSGQCPMPLLSSPSTFYSTVSVHSLFVSYPFSARTNDLYKPLPSSLPTPMIWLDAASIETIETSTGSSSVKRWRDKSGNNYHALAPFNNLPNAAAKPPLFSTTTLGVQFTGSLSHSLVLPDGALPFGNSPYTYFIIESLVSIGGTTDAVIYGGTTSGSQSFVIQQANGAIDHQWWDGGNFGPSNLLSTYKIQLVEAHYNSTLLRRTTWVNTAISHTSTPSGFRAQTQGPNLLGSRGDGAAFFSGSLYEVIAFNITLSSSQLVDIRSYLSTKWGNTSSLATSTSFPDSSGLSNSLTLPRGLRPSPLGALYFSFNGQSATIPPANSVNLTISLVYTWEGSAGVTIRALISSSSANFIFIAIRTVDGIVGFVSNGVFISSTSALQPRVQYCLALVAQNSTFSLYINGVSVLRSTLGFNASTRSPTILGNSASGLQTALGRFDDVRIWRRALSEQELASYNIVRIREFTTKNETVILNQTTPSTITTTYNETGSISGSGFSCNTTIVSTYSTPVLAQDTFADSTLPYSCIFAGNEASNNAGLGGDLLFSQSIASGSAVSWSNSLSIGSSSGSGGGSAAFIGVDTIKLSNLVINSSNSGSPIRDSGGFDGSNGGALMIQKPLSTSIVDSAFSQSTASSGGAIWLQSRLGYPISSTTRLSNILFNDNKAFYGGADIYADANDLPSCLNCSLESYSTASYYGPRSATGPRLARLLSSPYLQPFGTLSSALVVVGSIAVLQPLVQIELIDSLGHRVTSDNRSTCLISAVRNDTGGLLSLGFSSTYTANSGIISIFPFSVNNGPGVAGLISMSCTTSSDSFLEPLVLPLLSLPIGTSIVTVAWTEETLSSPIYFLSSTSDSPKPPSSPIKVKLIDGSGSTITSISVRCSLSITQAKNSFGAQTISSLEGFGNEVASISGIASFSPSMKSNSNSSILLSASCTWISGDVVSVSTPLLVRTYALSLMWSGGDTCDCGTGGGGLIGSCQKVCDSISPSIPNFGGGSLVVQADGSSWAVSALGVANRLSSTLTNTSIALATSALPSSLNTATLQSLSPTPKIYLLQSLSSGINASILNSVPPLLCTLSVVTSGSSFFTIAQQAILPPGTTLSSALTTSIVGTPQQTLTDGVAVFSGVGLRGSTFASAVPLSVTCTWVTDESLSSQLLLAIIPPVNLEWSASTLAASPLYTLACTAAQSYTFSHPVVVQLMNGATRQILTTSPSVSCTVSILSSVSGLTGAPTAVTLLGSTTVSTIGGIASFTLGLSGATNASILLSTSCTWISGDVISVTTPLLVHTYALSLMWSGGDTCDCSGNSNNSSTQALCQTACLTVTSTPSLSALIDSSNVFMSNDDPWLVEGNGKTIRRLLSRGISSLVNSLSSDVPSALPSSSDLQTLQPLKSAPTLVVVRSKSNGSFPVALLSPSLQCSISVDPSFTLNTFSTGAGNSVSGLTFVPAPISSVVGTSSLSSTNGRIIFDEIGLTGAGFGSIVPLSALCMWLTGEVITSPVLLARTNRLRARLLTFPPSSVLPSSATQLYILNPFPSVMIESCLSSNCSMSNSYSPFKETSLACTVSPVQINPITGLSISNTGIQLLGTLTSRTEANTATATFQRLSAVGPFDSAFYMSFACPWLSGDVILGASTPTLLAAVFASWATGDVNSSLALSTTKVNEPPRSCLFNTPFTVGVQLKYSLPVTSLSLYPPKRTSWNDLSDDPSSELSCSLGATVLGAPVLMTGLTTAQASLSGLALFPSIALLPALPSSINDPEQIVVLTATCFARGNVLPTVQASISIQRLSVKLLQRPPFDTLPASVAQPLPFSPLVVVALVNSTGTILTSESSATCTVSVASQSFAPFVPISNQQITLLGVMRSAMSGGVASFPGLSINGPLGSSADLNFDCTRSVGGIVFGTSSTVIVDVIQAKWQPPLLTLWQLYNTPSPVSALLQQFIPDPFNGWTVAAGSLPQPSPGLTCSLELSSVNGVSGLRISSTGNAGSSSKSSTGTSDQNGTVLFSLSLTGPAGNIDNVSALCSVAGQSFSTPLTPIAIETVVLVAVIPPPTVWLPSFSIARTPFSPAPKVLFTTKHGGIPVDAREASCQMSIDSPNATILEPPLAGYKLPPLRITAYVDSYGEFVTNETDILYQAMNTPIVLTNALIQSTSFGLILPMNIICKRSQGDETAPYSWNLRLVDADVEYIKPPPASIISQSAFSLYLRLFDRGSVATATASQVGSSLTYPTIELDNVTTCSLSVTTQDSLIILQNGVARSINGVVSFLGVSLAARSGSEVKGIITCSLGDLMYPTKLSWSITMQPCGPGTAPAGAGGYTCATCPSGTYSDGGVGVTTCTPCPGQGVSCAGGLLVLLPGFSRTQDNAVTIDSSTELYPCWAIDGCWVNLNTSDRKRHANYTHGCIKGYGGPLCGVCSVKERYAQSGGVCVPCLGEMLNLVVVSFIPLIVAAMVVWISFYRKVEESSKMQILLRIVLTYFQTLGTLSSIYSARGTIQFRALFGFTTAVGDSPLTLTPVQCTLRLPYYVRFGITISLPFSIAVLVLLANLIALAYARYRPSSTRATSSRSLMSSSSSSSSTGNRISTERGEKESLGQGEGGGGVRGSSFRDLTETRIQAVTQGTSNYFVQLRADVVRFFISQAWVAPVIFVLNASYSSLTTTCFSMFNCMPFSVGGTTYLAQDLSVSCYDTLHNGFRALAGLLIAFFGAGFPILFATILRRHRLELQKPDVFARLGFLYDGYTIERGMYIWESVVMVRKAAVVMIGSLIKDEYRQIFAAVTLLVFSLFLQAKFQPYELSLFNDIECISLVTIVLTQLVSMFYLRTESQMKQCMGESDVFVIDLQGTTCAQVKASAEGTDLFTTVLLVMVNVVFISTCLYLMYIFYKEKESKGIDNDDNSVSSRSNSLLIRSFRRLQKKFGAFQVSRGKEKSSITTILETSTPGDNKSETTIENPLRRLRSARLSSSMSLAPLRKLQQEQQQQQQQQLKQQKEEEEGEQLEQLDHSRRTDTLSKTSFSPVAIESLESTTNTSQRCNKLDISDDFEKSSLERKSSLLHINQSKLPSIAISDNLSLSQEMEIKDEKKKDVKEENLNLLPQDWIKVVSHETGETWFENIITGELQWEAPVIHNADLSTAWIRRTDETEDVWYENATDSTIVEWQVPEGGRIIDEEEILHQ
jgi:hypothetical protein